MRHGVCHDEVDIAVIVRIPPRAGAEQDDLTRLNGSEDACDFLFEIHRLFLGFVRSHRVARQRSMPRAASPRMGPPVGANPLSGRTLRVTRKRA